jgi:hypothetical protein
MLYDNHRHNNLRTGSATHTYLLKADGEVRSTGDASDIGSGRGGDDADASCGVGVNSGLLITGDADLRDGIDTTYANAGDLGPRWGREPQEEPSDEESFMH